MPVCCITMKLNKQCALLRSIYLRNYSYQKGARQNARHCLVIVSWLLSKSGVFNILDATDPKYDHSGARGPHPKI